MLEVPVAGRDTLAVSCGWIIAQTIKILEQSLPFSEDSYSPEKQFLGCKWALVETECLTTSQVTMQPKLPIMNWMLSDPPGHKIHSIHSSIPSLNGNGMYEIRLKQVLKAQISCIRKWHRCLWPVFLSHCLFPLNPNLWLLGEFPMTSWLTRKNSKPGLKMGLYNMLVLSKSGWLPHCRPAMMDGFQR